MIDDLPIASLKRTIMNHDGVLRVRYLRYVSQRLLRMNEWQGLNERA